MARKSDRLSRLWTPWESTPVLILLFGYLTITFTLVSSQPMTPEDAKAILDKHNEYRREESAANMYLMHWNMTLQERADGWAQRCQFKHERNLDVGENLFFDTDHENGVFLRGLKMWHDEKKDWRYSSDACITTCHYTQMVTGYTTTMGCSANICPSLRLGTQSFQNAMLLVCYYYPRGNFVGNFPFLPGAPCSKCGEGDTCSNQLCVTSSQESKTAPDFIKNLRPNKPFSPHQPIKFLSDFKTLLHSYASSQYHTSAANTGFHRQHSHHYQHQRHQHHISRLGESDRVKIVRTFKPLPQPLLQPKHNIITDHDPQIVPSKKRFTHDYTGGEEKTISSRHEEKERLEQRRREEKARRLAEKRHHEAVRLIALRKKEAMRIRNQREQEIQRRLHEERELRERERQAQERRDLERLENERLKLEQREKDRLEKEREEIERLESELRKQERLEEERREKERLELERREKERQEKERLEMERQKQERLEIMRRKNKRLEMERLEMERKEKERLENERLEMELKEKERLEMERRKNEKIVKERLEVERREKLRQEMEHGENDRLEMERRENERIELERKEKERKENEFVAKIREITRLDRERREKERLEMERQKQERLEIMRRKNKRLEMERLELERKEKERLEMERRENERLEKEHAERRISNLLDPNTRGLSKVDHEKRKKVYIHSNSINKPHGQNQLQNNNNMIRNKPYYTHEEQERHEQYDTIDNSVSQSVPNHTTQGNNQNHNIIIPVTQSSRRVSSHKPHHNLYWQHLHSNTEKTTETSVSHSIINSASSYQPLKANHTILSKETSSTMTPIVASISYLENSKKSTGKTSFSGEENQSTTTSDSTLPSASSHKHTDKSPSHTLPSYNNQNTYVSHLNNHRVNSGSHQQNVGSGFVATIVKVIPRTKDEHEDSKSSSNPFDNSIKKISLTTDNNTMEAGKPKSSNYINTGSNESVNYAVPKKFKKNKLRYKMSMKAIRRADRRRRRVHKRMMARMKKKRHPHRDKFAFDRNGKRCVDRLPICNMWVAKCDTSAVVTLACPLSCGKCGQHVDISTLLRDGYVHDSSLFSKREYGNEVHKRRHRKKKKWRSNEVIRPQALTLHPNKQGASGDQALEKLGKRRSKSRTGKERKTKRRRKGRRRRYRQGENDLCHDDQYHIRTCRIWVRRGFCDDNVIIKTVYCRWSCGNCD